MTDESSDESADESAGDLLDGSETGLSAESRAESPAGSPVDWPAAWSGVVESVVATRGLGGSWNVAALGLFSPDHHGGEDGSVHARTWGRTETRRNFASRGGGVVQFTRDSLDFVEAACSVREEDDPVLESADAWVEVEAERVETERIGSATDGEVERVEWALVPVETHVEREVVPTTSRAHAAVVEATVAASRLDVTEYDPDVLRDRIRYSERVVESCGGAREHEAWERFEELVDWRRE